MLQTLLPQQAGFRLLDLGCASGGLLYRLGKARPDGHYTGVELSPLSYLLSWLRTRANPATQSRWGDFWQVDLAPYDVVYAYLSPAAMPRLWRKVNREMRPGSVFVSNSFCVPGVEPAQALPVGDRMRSTLYVWHM